MKILRKQWGFLAIIALGLMLHILAERGEAPITDTTLASAGHEATEIDASSRESVSEEERGQTRVVIELLSLDGHDMKIVIEPPASTR